MAKYCINGTVSSLFDEDDEVVEVGVGEESIVDCELKEGREDESIVEEVEELGREEYFFTKE